MRFPSILTGTLSISLLAATACTINQVDDDGGAGGAAPAGTTITTSFDGLEALGDGYVYEGWLIVDGTPVSTGRFNLTDGQTEYTFSVEQADAQAAGAFVLTIEPEVGDDPAPSAIHILAGDIASDAAALTVDHMAALGTDFAGVTGNYIIETPTSAETTDYNQGVWWLSMGANGPEASLSLDALPAGWEYEGWVVGPDGPISIGKFSSAAGADSDGAGPTAGDEGAPPFPGQDFIEPALDLTEQTGVDAGTHALVISVEPMPDDSAAPFALKPLVDGNIEDVGGGMSQDMANNAAATNPTGTYSVAYE